MLTRLIVASYAWLLEAALWVALALAGLVGYHFTVDIMDAVGAVPTPVLGWKILGGLVFVGIAFLFLAVFAGPVLVLMDVRQVVRSIEARLEQAGRSEDIRGPLAPERKEPSI